MVGEAIMASTRIAAVCIKVVSTGGYGFGDPSDVRAPNLYDVGRDLVERLSNKASAGGTVASCTESGFVTLLPMRTWDPSTLLDRVIELIGDCDSVKKGDRSADISLTFRGGLAHIFLGVSCTPDDARDAEILVETAMKRAWDQLPGAWDEGRMWDAHGKWDAGL